MTWKKKFDVSVITSILILILWIKTRQIGILFFGWINRCRLVMAWWPWPCLLWLLASTQSSFRAAVCWARSSYFRFPSLRLYRLLAIARYYSHSMIFGTCRQAWLLLVISLCHRVSSWPSSSRLLYKKQQMLPENEMKRGAQKCKNIDQKWGNLFEKIHNAWGN